MNNIHHLRDYWDRSLQAFGIHPPVAKPRSPGHCTRCDELVCAYNDAHRDELIDSHLRTRHPVLARLCRWVPQLRPRVSWAKE